MAFGAQIRNDANRVQIDQDFISLSFRSKFTVNSMSAAAFYASAGFEASPVESNIVYYYVDYPAANNALIAVQPPVGVGIAPVSLINEAGSGSPPPAGYRRAVFCSSGTTSRTITVFVFDTPSLLGLSNTGMGMQLRDAGGNVIFHSNTKLMRPQSLVTLRGANVGSTISLNSSRSYAFCFCNPSKGWYYKPTGGSRTIKNAGLQLNSSTQAQIVDVNHYALYAQMVSGAMIDNWPVPGLVIDVSFM